MVKTLAMRLNVEETRQETIDEIVSVYSLHGNLDAVASHWGVSRRTVERWMRDTPELARAIEGVRAKTVFRRT